MLWTAAETWPFGSALLIMLVLAVIEGAGLVLAVSPSAFLDSLVPDVELDSALGLGWLHLGRVPMLVLLILFLTGFALSGYLLQMVLHGLSGHYLPAWLASVPAFFVGLATVSSVGAVVARIVPKDETASVSESTLIGRVAVIVMGDAQRGTAAQAKVRDEHGHIHYLMVEPDEDAAHLPEGSSVLLVRKVGARFYVIANPHPELLN